MSTRTLAAGEMTMKSIHRERFELCMGHRESDKIPADLWLDSNDPGVKTKLLRYTSQDRYEDLLDYFDIDIYRFKPDVSPKAKGTAGEIADFFLPVPNTNYLSFSNDSVRRPLIHVETPAELDAFAWPSGDLFDYSNFDSILDSQSHRVLWAQAGTWSPVFCKMCDLCGIEKVLVDLIENPDLIRAMTIKIVDFYKDSFRRTLEAAKGRLDVMGFGDDIATQQGLMFSKELWLAYFKDPMKELCDLIQSYGVYVAFHSCGAVSEMIPEFVDAGADIVFPIQPRARGMEAERLKKEFGSDVVLYGGIDIQETLPFGSAQDVRDEVAHVAGILSKDGGYILASAHGLMSDVPPANVCAMYDERNKKWTKHC